MSAQYKWSWTDLSGDQSAFASNSPDYAATQTDLSTIQQYGVYTVTMYDYSGNQIAPTKKVINVAPFMNAAAGRNVAWQTIGQTTIANLLTPGGAGAKTAESLIGANATTTVDWSFPAGAVYPNPWVSINSLVAKEYKNGVQWYQAQYYNSTSYATPTPNGVLGSLKINGYVDQLTVVNNTPAETAVQVQLGWQADGEFYSNTLQYNSN